MTTDNTDDDKLKDLLDSAAPDQPGLTPGERTSAVTGRAQAVTRRNRFVLAAAVLAVVGAGVGVPLALSGGDDPRGSTSDVADDAPPPAPEPVACPTEAFAFSDSDPALPTSATSARFCPATEFDGQPSDLDRLPLEPLTEGLDALLASLAALPAGKLADECAFTTYQSEPWSIVIGDGEEVVAAFGSPQRGCSVVAYDGVERNVEDVLAVMTDAIAAQEGDVPTETGTACPTDQQYLEAEPDTTDKAYLDFVPIAGSVCYQADPLGAPEYAEDTGELDAATIESLYASIGRGTTAEPSNPGMCTDTGPTRLVVLVDAAGDRITWTDASCTGEFTSLYGWWQPSDVDELAITEALGGRDRG